MDKRKLRKIEEALLNHLMILELPIERWEIVDDVVIIEWMEGKDIKQAKYDIGA